MFRPSRATLAALFAGGLALAAGAEEPAPQGAALADASALADFENHVRPLLAGRCLKCHGDRKQESSLRLDARARMMQGGDSGPAIVPGKPDESLLVKAIRHEGDLKMPPGGRLNAEQIATLTRWIAVGAPWPDGGGATGVRGGAVTPEDRAFWSFRPRATTRLPEVADPRWASSPVDRWIGAGLEARRLRPVGPADRRTLIRRATFDLTGLPPTIDEVDAFLTGPSPSAFARVVDRLLASPAYGERWGRYWLDVVRYADTAGETADYPVPQASRYRDYVIDAFNRDLPYDEFVREQVAGDLLAAEGPRARFAARVAATGFLAVSRRFGFDSENYHHLTIQDTIDTLGQAFLGLTIGCARCHDHKFDPISTRDYYALYGIFESTRYSFPGSEQKSAVRVLAPLLPRDEAESRREAFLAELAGVEADLEALGAPRPRIKVRTLDDHDGDFELQAVSAGGSIGCLVPPWRSEGRAEATARAQSPYTNVTGRVGTVGVTFPGDAASHRVWQRLWPSRTASNHDRLAFNLDFRVEGQGNAPAGAYRVALGHGEGRSPAVEIFIAADSLRVRSGDSLVAVRTLRPGTWYNLQLTLDLKRRTFAGNVASPGDRKDFAGREFSSAWDGTIDGVVLDGEGPVTGVRPVLDVDNVGVRDRSFPPLVATHPPLLVTTAAAVAMAADLATADRLPALIARRARLVLLRGTLERRYAELIADGPCALAYGVAEGTPRDARIQKRGEPEKLGARVPRRFLEVLGGDPLPPGDGGSGRRQLAEWLTRPENPLTARVMVNRIWEWHFGNGLVATENDFGKRGKAPSHPALLDDLARRFTAEGWSIKALHRLIMNSATYQLASDYDANADAVDPGDALLWRFPRRRLDAEAIRDALLAMGGSLDRTPGRPHPFPPLGTTFTQHGPFNAVYDTNSRSVYLMTQRIKRHPFLALFDGADPNATTAKRMVTTVPTQALFFMNDPFVHAQSLGFAQRLLEERGDERERLDLAYRRTLARAPEASEGAAASAFLERYHAHLAAEGVPEGERPARSWAALARTLFASDEFLFID